MSTLQQPNGNSSNELPPALPAEFDKTQFQHSITVKALRIPTQQCHHYMKLLVKHLLHKPRMKNVRDIPGENEWRLLLLEEGLEPGSFSDRVVLPLLPNNSKKNKKGASTDDKPSENNMTLQTVIDQDGLAITDASIELTYDDMSPADVLRRLIPSHIKEVPSSFEQVGHIAHMNLREDLLPYRLIIGAVLLEKNLPRVRTIINKIGTIENEWRVFLMEVLAGEDNTVAEVRQHGSRFCLDFKKVYWNSRLEAEHSRLVDKWFVPGEVIADAMAGVGPFAVPAGKKGCRVVANDLNPDSYRWLVENIKINKVESSVCPYEMDGREFMRSAAGGKLQVVWPAPPKQPQNKKKTKKNQGDDDKEEKGEKVASAYSGVIPPFHHIVMNLPATAVEFLDALRGSFDPEMWKDRDLPMVHVYAFLKKEETVQDLQRRIETALGGPIDAPIDSPPEFFAVRDVSPSKQMFCVSFRVPAAVAFAQDGADAGDNDNDAAKRQKII